MPRSPDPDEIAGSFTRVTPVIDGWTMQPVGWMRGMTFWLDGSDPRCNCPPSPMMYDADLEETEPPVGCDHGFPLESESDDGDDEA